MTPLSRVVFCLGNGDCLSNGKKGNTIFPNDNQNGRFGLVSIGWRRSEEG